MGCESEIFGDCESEIFVCEKLGGANMTFKGSGNIMCNSDPEHFKMKI